MKKKPTNDGDDDEMFYRGENIGEKDREDIKRNLFHQMVSINLYAFLNVSFKYYFIICVCVVCSVPTKHFCFK